MNNFGFYLALILYIIGIVAFIFNQGKNFLMLIISLELILLAIAVFSVHLSFQLDDLIGSNYTLQILPLAGAESAIGLALLIAFYPNRGTINFTSRSIFMLIYTILLTVFFGFCKTLITILLLNIQYFYNI